METCTDIIYRDINEFYNNADYKTFKTEPEVSDIYLPAPYLPVDISMPETAKQICKLLKVDAVADITFQFQRIKDDQLQVTAVSISGMPVLTKKIHTEKIRLIAKIIVIDKEGGVVFSRYFYQDSKSNNYKLKKMKDHFAFNMINATILGRISGAFITNLVDTIQLAKKS